MAANSLPDLLDGLKIHGLAGTTVIHIHIGPVSLSKDIARLLVLLIPVVIAGKVFQHQQSQHAA